MTDGFKVGNGFKQGDGLTSILFNTASEYVIRQMSVIVRSTITNLCSYEDMQMRQTLWEERK